MSSTERPPRFGAVVTAMVTPFNGQGEVDLDGAVALARWLTDHGSHGLVVAGTTGEGPVLSDAERLELFRAVSEAVTVPVIAGTGTNDTRHTCALTAAACRTGVAGVLVVTPYYNRPSQSGLLAHFAAAAEAAGNLPVLLYDIPVRTGRRIAHDTMLRLAERAPNVVGVKDAADDVIGTAQLVARAPDGFQVYSGTDAATLPLLAVGAVGVVSVASHWVGPQLGAMVRAHRDGDVAAARALDQGMAESFAFESTEADPNPLPTKAVMRALGLPAGQCRLPMGPARPELDDAAADLVARLGVSRQAEPTAGAGSGGG